MAFPVLERTYARVVTSLRDAPEQLRHFGVSLDRGLIDHAQILEFLRGLRDTVIRHLEFFNERHNNLEIVTRLDKHLYSCAVEDFDMYLSYYETLLENATDDGSNIDIFLNDLAEIKEEVQRRTRVEPWMH